MHLYHLVSHIWKFSFKAKYEEGGYIPSDSIWQFTVDGSLSFMGKSYGEGHPTLSWRFSNDRFFIEGSQYGLIEFGFDELMINISGESILDNNTVIQFAGSIVSPLDDKFFSNSFRTYLGGTWKLSILGVLGLFYIRFENNFLFLYDIYGMKYLYNEDHGFEDEDWENGLKYIQYIFMLEGSSIIIYDKITLKKVGTLHLDNNRNINGTFHPPFTSRPYFVEMKSISEDNLVNDFKDIFEDLRIIK